MPQEFISYLDNWAYKLREKIVELGSVYHEMGSIYVRNNKHSRTYFESVQLFLMLTRVSSTFFLFWVYKLLKFIIRSYKLKIILFCQNHFKNIISSNKKPLGSKLVVSSTQTNKTFGVTIWTFINLTAWFYTKHLALQNHNGRWDSSTVKALYIN